MKMWPKKLITIVTEKILENDVIDVLKKNQMKGFTVTDARGEGARGVRSAAWDQVSNIRVEIVCDEERAQTICEVLHEEFYENYAMIVFVSSVETLRDSKF